jgi:hypothetical protein
LKSCLVIAFPSIAERTTAMTRRGLRHVLEKETSQRHQTPNIIPSANCGALQDAKPCVGLPILAILLVYDMYRKDTRGLVVAVLFLIVVARAR